MKRRILGIAIGIVLMCQVPVPVAAHQPRVPETGDVTVTDPEISKAYYNRLTGTPHIYRIAAPEPFALYVNILVPEASQKTDMSAGVFLDGTQIADLSGADQAWTTIFEPFGFDTYRKGPEYRNADSPAGMYEIRVSNPGNTGVYVLAVGEREVFGTTETLNTVSLVPRIKRELFGTHPASFLLSPIGGGYALGMVSLSFLFGFAYRSLLRRSARSAVRKRVHNIGFSDRALRAGIGIVLFVWAVTTTWSPLLLFAAGFCLFESLFSWCGFYAAIGRNTCPLV